MDPHQLGKGMDRLIYSLGRVEKAAGIGAISSSLRVTPRGVRTGLQVPRTQAAALHR